MTILKPKEAMGGHMWQLLTSKIPPDPTEAQLHSGPGVIGPLPSLFLSPRSTSVLLGCSCATPTASQSSGFNPQLPRLIKQGAIADTKPHLLGIIFCSSATITAPAVRVNGLGAPRASAA